MSSGQGPGCRQGVRDEISKKIAAVSVPPECPWVVYVLEDFTMKQTALNQKSQGSGHFPTQAFTQQPQMNSASLWYHLLTVWLFVTLSPLWAFLEDHGSGGGGNNLKGKQRSPYFMNMPTA